MLFAFLNIIMCAWQLSEIHGWAGAVIFGNDSFKKEDVFECLYKGSNKFAWSAAVCYSIGLVLIVFRTMRSVFKGYLSSSSRLVQFRSVKKSVCYWFLRPSPAKMQKLWRNCFCSIGEFAFKLGHVKIKRILCEYYVAFSRIFPMSLFFLLSTFL